MSKPFFGLQSIEEKMASLLKPLFSGSKKEFILVNNLVKNWEQVIGKKYAEFCYPKSVNLGKEKSVGGKLTIGVYNPAVGFFLESNAEIIIERIASFYGFKTISKIIIKQEPKVVEGHGVKEIKLPQAQESFLSDKIADVEDQDLAETLRKLGREVLNKK
ncbi:MAG: DUF721 domain-containing protein [Rickettsiales bacterium]|nr:DUF721 domain-containing protein [Rickettsiales bacterium]